MPLCTRSRALPSSARRLAPPIVAFDQPPAKAMPARVSSMARSTAPIARSRWPPLFADERASSARARTEHLQRTHHVRLGGVGDRGADHRAGDQAGERRHHNETRHRLSPPRWKRGFPRASCLAVRRCFFRRRSCIAYIAVARLAAQVTALSEAVTMLESMPTPHRTLPSAGFSLDVTHRLGILAGAGRVLVIVAHADPDAAVLAERLDIGLRSGRCRGR